MKKHLAISIISHNQATLVADALHDIEGFCDKNLEIILTINIEETLPFTPKDFSIPITLIKNNSPKGFGANHNAAFKQTDSEFFCVLNPDIRLLDNAFTKLFADFKNSNIGIVAPRIIDSMGSTQDNARKLPTPWSILKRTLCNKREPDYLLESTSNPITVDWVAGMFMLFRSNVFKQLDGFDERFFMYCEDIDICVRAHTLNHQVLLDPTVSVIHNAQRDSHKSLRYLKWHISSLLRFFYKHRFIKKIYAK